MSAIETTIYPNKKIVIFGKNLGITKSQFHIVVYLSVYTFLTYAYYSLFSPFYPGIATEKGMSDTEIGIIFGVYPFVILILSPFFGKYVITYAQYF